MSIWISWGGGGCASWNSVCQKVEVESSKAFVPGSSSPLVSSLSTFTSFQAECETKSLFVPPVRTSPVVRSSCQVAYQSSTSLVSPEILIGSQMYFELLRSGSCQRSPA